LLVVLEPIAPVHVHALEDARAQAVVDHRHLAAGDAAHALAGEHALDHEFVLHGQLRGARGPRLGAPLPLDAVLAWFDARPRKEQPVAGAHAQAAGQLVPQEHQGLLAPRPQALPRLQGEGADVGGVLGLDGHQPGARG
jgi:hypothetical protein